jgi:hypothetical protein
MRPKFASWGAVALLLGVAIWTATPAGQQAGPTGASHVPDEVIVKFSPQANPARRNALVVSISARLLRRFETLDLHHLRLPGGLTVNEAIAALPRTPT